MRSAIQRRLSLHRRRRRILPGLWRRRPWLMAGLVLAAALAVVAHRSVAPMPVGDDYERYHGKVFSVARVVDGDTVDLAVPDGRHAQTRVRLWGVDTPEIAGSDRGEMYYGPQASAFAKAALAGRDVEVWLVREKTRGLYGRLLAYLKVPGEDVTFNERLIETGHAYADWRFDHPYKEHFLDVERRARRNRSGLWANVRPEQMPAWRQRTARRSGTPRVTSAPNGVRSPTTPRENR